MARSTTNLLVVHVSATQPSQDIGAVEIDRMHRQRGFKEIGYHFVIRRDGTLELGRPLMEVGAHVEGHNATSVGVCLVGGINASGKAENNMTPEQFVTLRSLLNTLHDIWPTARICGHRDLSPDTNGDGKITPNEYIKECPCFDVEPWWASVGKRS